MKQVRHLVLLSALCLVAGGASAQSSGEEYDPTVFMMYVKDSGGKMYAAHHTEDRHSGKFRNET